MKLLHKVTITPSLNIIIETTAAAPMKISESWLPCVASVNVNQVIPIVDKETANKLDRPPIAAQITGCAAATRPN